MDKKAVKKISENDYFNYLIEQYGNLIFSICYKSTQNYFDAEDLTQETYLSIYRNLHTFDGSQEKAWVCRIATNKCLDFLKRAAGKTVPTEDTYFIEMESGTLSPEASFLETDVKSHLKKLCSSLKPPYNQIALDYFYYEIPLKELAEKTNKNIKTLQTQVYRAKAMLRKLWRKEN